MKKTDSFDVSAKEYAAAVTTIFGDASSESRQMAHDLECAYHAIAAAIADCDGTWTDQVLFEVIPGRVFELAASASWIDYFDDDGDPRTEMEGDAELSGWSVQEKIRDAFVRLLPIRDYLDVYPSEPSATIGKEWRQPTPRTLIDEFIGTKRRPSKLWLARQMAKSPGYVHTEFAAIQFIKLRRREPKPKRTQAYTDRGRRQAEVLTRIFKHDDPIKYSDLKASHFFWAVDG